MSQFFSYQDEQITTGDTVRIHQEIQEAGDEKARVQIFEGIVIAIKNSGTGKSLTVRKVGSNGIGVEKIYPINMPAIKKIELKRQGQTRRSKLYYLRDRVGKAATRIKEKSVVSAPAKTA
jgi:large subunit ribosomal protein L19